MEKSDLEAERVALFESVMKNQRSMKELESNLLCRLTSIQVCTEYYFASFSTVHTLYGTIKRVQISREYSNPLNHLTLFTPCIIYFILSDQLIAMPYILFVYKFDCDMGYLVLL
jgi:hypothetical protein